MNAFRPIILAVACALPALAAAQWQWLDKDGRKVFSDRAPPADIAPGRILKQPGVRQADPATTASANAAAAASAAAGPAPKLATADKDLEARRKQAEAAEADKRKKEEEQKDAARAENCKRAKDAKATYDSGVRVARTNAQGEREFVDDAQRKAEVTRLEAIIAKDCKT